MSAWEPTVAGGARQARAGDALRWVSGAAIVLAAALWAGLVLRTVAGIGPADLPLALLGVLVGGLVADGLTGVVHWACDTWGDERTPALGPTLIYAFREHHVEPLAMLDSDWATTNREPGIAAALFLLVLSLPACESALAGRPLAAAFLVAFVFYGSLANQLHLWAHAPRAPRIVRMAQRLGLVLSPRRHARHHRAPHTDRYCISTGWLNPLLDAVGFWRRLERLVSRLTGAMPRAGMSTNRSVNVS